VTGNDIKFEGPRPIRKHERVDGYKLFEICFGHPISSNEDEFDHPSAQDKGWQVMLPASGSFKGKPVSQISTDLHQIKFNDCHLRIGSIGGVSTHPDFRGLGLAGKILSSCASQLKEQGSQLMLVSGMRGLYTRTGNVPAMRFYHFRLNDSSVRSAYLPQVTLRPLNAADMPACARIYQSEAVSYVRKLNEYPASFSPGRAWIVEIDAVPVAYLLLYVPWEHRNGPEQGVREVLEYAGSRLALTAALSQILAGTTIQPQLPQLNELRLSVPWQDLDLIQLLQPLAASSSQETLLGHTMRLINFPAVLDNLEPYIAARLPQETAGKLHFEQSGPLLVDPDLGERSGDFCAIQWEKHRLELSTGDMTRLVFGDWDFSKTPQNLSLPTGSPLIEIVKALFPLPSFQPGLNFR